MLDLDTAHRAYRAAQLSALDEASRLCSAVEGLLNVEGVKSEDHAFDLAVLARELRAALTAVEQTRAALVEEQAAGQWPTWHSNETPFYDTQEEVA